MHNEFFHYLMILLHKKNQFQRDVFFGTPGTVCIKLQNISNGYNYDDYTNMITILNSGGSAYYSREGHRELLA